MLSYLDVYVPDDDYQEVKSPSGNLTILFWKLVGEVYSCYEGRCGESGAKNVFLLYQVQLADEIYRQLMRHQMRKEGFFEERVLEERGTNYRQQYRFERHCV